MKKILCISAILIIAITSGYAQWGLINKAIDKADSKPSKQKQNKEEESSQPETTKEDDAPAGQEPAAAPSPAPSLKVYANYDFVPGDKILFEDNFADDQDGEFPSHWELNSGQAVLNKVGNEEAFFLTEGNYAKVLPRMKTEKYLSEPFTIEYDYYHAPGAYGLVTMLMGTDKEGSKREANVYVNESEASFTPWEGNAFSKTFPEEFRESFNNKWHHVAMAFKNHQLKIYVDQNRTLVVPDTKGDFESIMFGGIGDEKNPIVFKNIRIASGGDMNMIGKKFTESKIVTHGINFDVNKATIRPESMGTLNMIVQVMKDNPAIKFEVGGHTDSDGADDLNMKLSQQRAEAVKSELINMGIDASRLTAKGYGKTKPISDNSTLDGKANNRRVEFVKT